MMWRILSLVGAGLSLQSVVAFPWMPNPWVAVSTTALCLAATALCWGLADKT